MDVSRKWRTGFLILLALISLFMISIFLNRAKFMPPPYVGHFVSSSVIIQSGDREFLIVIVGDTFPNSTETASIEVVGDQMNVYFKLRNSLFPELPFGKSKTTFGSLGDWDHVFAFDLTPGINTVVDMRTDTILWERQEAK